MRTPFRILGPALLGLLVSAFGCGSSTPAGSGGSSSSGTTTTTSSACATDAGVHEYAVGLAGESATGELTVTFLDADPAPPAKGDNTFLIKVTDGQGQPVVGATIVTQGYMPAHGHPLSIKPATTPKGSDGTYEITPVTLFMPGVWEVTFEITPVMGAAGSVKFSFCADN